MQQKVAAVTQPIVYRAAQSVLADESCSQQVLNVADLGCSSGPNTFTVMSTVIESMVEKCSELKCQVPEIQFYLNDPMGNDFNTLFKGLSGVQEKYKNVTCFAMGAPVPFMIGFSLGTPCILCIPLTVSVGSQRCGFPLFLIY